jgi:branched-chain amino acid transport system permease protein
MRSDLSPSHPEAEVSDFVHFVVDALGAAGRIGMLAVGFALIFRITGHLHFAIGAIWTFCSYVMASLLEAGQSAIVGFLVALVVGWFLAAVSYAIYRRLSGEFTVVLASFGLFLAILGGQALLWGATAKGVDPSRLMAQGQLVDYGAGRVFVAWLDVSCLLGLAISAVILAWFFGRTGAGVQSTAVSENRDLARSMGVPIVRIELFAYMIGTAIAIASAALHVMAVGADTFTGPNITIPAIVVALGAGPVVVGTAVIAVLFGAMLSLAQLALGTEWVTIATYTALLALIFWKPAGLLRHDVIFPPRRGLRAGLRFLKAEGRAS